MDDILTIVKQADIFYKLTPVQLEMVASLCEERAYALGEVIVVEGGKSEEIFIIAQGEVDIIITPSRPSGSTGQLAKPVIIARLRPGQSFGEVGLVDNGVRSATARSANKDTRMLVIANPRLMRLCDTYPELGYRLMRNLATDLALKIRNTDLRIREQLIYGEHKPEGAGL
jgi:CRP/FNR family cyclic AMP-dependent transcriptional regulator